MELKDAVTSGNPTDIQYLYHAIKDYNQGTSSRSTFQFKLHLPTNWDGNEVKRLQEWLTILGFQEEFFSSKVVYTSQNLIEIYRLLVAHTLESAGTVGVSGGVKLFDTAVKAKGISPLTIINPSTMEADNRNRSVSDGSLLVNTRGSYNMRVLTDRIYDGSDDEDSPSGLTPTFRAINDSTLDYSSCKLSINNSIFGQRLSPRSLMAPSPTSSITQQLQGVRVSSNEEVLATLHEVEVNIGEEYIDIDSSSHSDIVTSFGAVVKVESDGTNGTSSLLTLGVDHSTTSSSMAKQVTRLVSNMNPVKSSIDSFPVSESKTNHGSAISPTSPNLLGGSISSTLHHSPGWSEERQRKHINRHALRRSNSMPIKFTQNVNIGTPGGVSLSQQEPSSSSRADNFQTPQSRFKFSGRGDNDWGTSQPASVTCLSRMASFLPPASVSSEKCNQFSSNSSLSSTFPSSGGTCASHSSTNSKANITNIFNTYSTSANRERLKPTSTSYSSFMSISNNYGLGGIPALHMTDRGRLMSPVTTCHSLQGRDSMSPLLVHSVQSADNFYRSNPHSETDFSNQSNDDGNVDISVSYLESQYNEHVQPNTDVIRDRRRRRNSIAKERRRSFGRHRVVQPLMLDNDDSMYAISLSPGVSQQAATSTRKKRLSGAMILSAMPNLHELNFTNMVVGGYYQHSFQDNKPVIAPVANGGISVVGVRLCRTSNTLELQLNIPGNGMQIYSLGTSWKVMSAAPTGYLVGSCDSFANVSSRSILFYLPYHPYEWIAVSSARNRCMKVINSIFAFSSLSLDIKTPIETIPNEFLGASNCYVSVSSDSNMFIDHPKEWNQSWLIMSILEFLIGVDGGSNAASTVATTSHAYGTRRGKAPFLASCITPEEILSYKLVSKTWVKCYYSLLARHISITSNLLPLTWQNWARFYTSHQFGFYLSDGACKEVYAVLNTSHPSQAHMEAVSIMDITDLQRRNMESSLSQELQISMVTSSLVSLNICPNLVQIYSVFKSEYKEPESWKLKSHEVHSAATGNSQRYKIKSKKDGNYQYIRMEFCTGGDVEHIIRVNKHLPISTIRSYLFQMCYALYSCRVELDLRHYDIKLLNFFATNGLSLFSHSSSAYRALTRPGLTIDQDKFINIRVGLGPSIYSLIINSQNNELIKLADFGTSYIGMKGLGQCITIEQFTTLENTPIEFLLLGSDARQSYSSDTFCLGLSFLHLMTGYEPYEELLKDVHCPEYLRDRLKVYYDTNDSTSPYYIISELMACVDTSSADDAAQEYVLYDTLYRYLVLFGFGYKMDVIYHNNVIFQTLYNTLVVTNDTASTALEFERLRQCRRQWQNDRQCWSIHVGVSPVMIHLRQRLSQLGNGSMSLLESMVNFDPSRRCSMLEALHHPIFNCFLEDQVNNYDSEMTLVDDMNTAGAVRRQRSTSGTIYFNKSYMHYHRGSSDSLPHR